MEIFEQLRLLMILIMAALSFRYVSNQPLALLSSDDEEEEQADNEIPAEKHAEDVEL